MEATREGFGGANPGLPIVAFGNGRAMPSLEYEINYRLSLNL